MSPHVSSHHFQFLIFPDFKKGLFSGSGPGGRRFKSSLPDHFESMTSGRFRGTRKPPPWAELRAGCFRRPHRVAFWCDIFLPRDSMSLAENLSSVSRHPYSDGVFDSVAVGSRYLPHSGDTKPKSNNLRSRNARAKTQQSKCKHTSLLRPLALTRFTDCALPLTP